MLTSIPQTASLILSIVLLGYLTFHQTFREVIIRSNVIFASLYFAFFYSGFLHPKKKLNRHEYAEWCCRQVSDIHALIMVWGAIRSFMEWNHISLEEGFVGKPTFAPVFYCAVSMGYLQWDLLWQLYHMDGYYDASSLIHHILYLAVCHYNMQGYFFCRPFAWLVFGELSTIFLNRRWFYAASDRKESMGYIVSSVMFAVTFLSIRVALYTWGFFDIWKHKSIWLELPQGIRFVVFGLHVGYVLNLFWGVKVWNALVRLIKRQLQTSPISKHDKNK